MLTRISKKIIPTNAFSHFVGGLHHRAMREAMGADEPFPIEEREGFVILSAVEHDHTFARFTITDDDDKIVLIDRGKSYEYYLRAMNHIVYYPTHTVPDKRCPVTGEIGW